MAATRKRSVTWTPVVQYFARSERDGLVRVASLNLVAEQFVVIGLELPQSASEGAAAQLAHIFANHSHVDLGSHQSERAARAAGAAFIRWETPAGSACGCSEVRASAGNTAPRTVMPDPAGDGEAVH